MTAVQGEVGRIRIFEDFTGGIDNLADTGQPPVDFPPYFQLVGQGMSETDQGAIILDSDGLSGVVQLQSTNESEHCIGLQTAVMFDVGLMGTIVAEARVRFAALTTKEFFFGFSDVVTDAGILEGAIAHGANTTMTLTASDICGFWLSTELTDGTDWHMLYNGGTTTGNVYSTDIDADDGAVAGEFQILRLEMDNNGTARWFIDGVLKQTTATAVSTTTDLACQLMVEEKGTTGSCNVDVDYILIEANRDWTI